jgi:inner membrane protein
MDPLAHTLVGATLAETGLKRASRLGALSLMVGANLPDVDAVAILWGQDTALLARRGWTHGIVGLAVLPWIWVGMLAAFDRVVTRRRDPAAPKLRLGLLLGLTYLAALTHPVLDWLNTYGVRLLMPFDTRWYYGDALFIIDPWVWLLMGSAVVLAHSRSKLGITGWTILALATTALIVGVDRTPPPAKVAWLVGVGLIVAGRLRGLPTRAVGRLASTAVVLVALYVVAVFHGNRIAEERTSQWLRAQGLQAEVVMVGPVPARPFARDVVARTVDHYHFVEMAWFGREPFVISHPPVPIGDEDDAVIRAALRAPSVRGLRAWLRLPAYAVERTQEGYRVTIRDVRYARPESERPTSLGRAIVDLDSDLAPR